MAEYIYRILLLGDFHFGESYSKAGAQVLEKFGYQHSLKFIKPFADAADTFIINLETPVVDPIAYPSPFKGEKSYVHWADVEKTPQALNDLGVDAVSLANNHTVDHGLEGFLRSLESLSKAGIPWFGAGKNIDEARKPFVIDLPEEAGGGEVHFHGSFQYSRAYAEKFGFYADDSSPGCAPLMLQHGAGSQLGDHRDDILNIAFPHWGANYQWRSTGQRRTADKLLDEGMDLIIGHGSHALQQIERRKRRWVAYSIGNGNFQSGGRFDRYIDENGILPMGAWAMLHVQLGEQSRRLELRLYPIYSDNRATGFQPRPVSHEDFMRALDRLKEMEAKKGRFTNRHSAYGRDDLGWYIRLKLGDWPVGGRPEPLAAARGRTAGESHRIAAPQEFEDDSIGIYSDPDSLYVREQQTRHGKNVAPLLISRVAEKGGATTTWVDSRIAVIEMEGKRWLLQGHRGTESAVGKALISDKYLSKRLLLAAGVSTPRGDLARTAEQAVTIQARYGTAVVVKPRFGLKGIGVSVNLRTPEEIEAAFNRANAVAGGVVVEEYVEGSEEYRCLTTPEECVSVVRRVLPNVTGDGVSTIKELILKKNERRAQNPSTFNRPIPLNAVTEIYLKRHGLSYDYVPAAGMNLTVRDVGGLSSGGEPMECSNVVDPAVKETAKQAASAIPGLAWGGADVMTATKDGRPYVIEVNSDADIAGATFPFYGDPVDVAVKMWRMRLERGAAPVRSAPVAAEPLTASQHVPGMEPGSGRGQAGRRLSVLLHSYAREHQCEVYEESPTVTRIVDLRGQERWMRECLSTADLAIVNEVVRRHRIVRRLLAQADVPRVRGKMVRSRKQLDNFVKVPEFALAVVPYRHAWDGPRARNFSNAEDLPANFFNGRSQWIVQSRPHGQNFRVAASPHEALVVLSDGLASADLVEAVSRRAVEAIRAIPELRWGFVDIVMRDDKPVALVEGLSLNPLILPGSRVIAGSWDSLMKRVLPLATSRVIGG